MCFGHFEKKHTFCEKRMLDVAENQVDGGKGFWEDVSWMFQLVLKSSLHILHRLMFYKSLLK